MPRALRARLALVTALMAVFVTGGCALSSDYTDGDGDVGSDSGVRPVDSGPFAGDATGDHDSSDGEVGDTGSSPVDAAADVDAGPGPWGDYCFGIPEIVSPVEGGAVGATAQIVMTLPPCLKQLAVYVDNDAGYGPMGINTDGSFTVTVAIPLGQHRLNVHAWDNTNDAHAAPQIGVDRTQ